MISPRERNRRTLLNIFVFGIFPRPPFSLFYFFLFFFFRSSQQRKRRVKGLLDLFIRIWHRIYFTFRRWNFGKGKFLIDIDRGNANDEVEKVTSFPFFLSSFSFLFIRVQMIFHTFFYTSFLRKIETDRSFLVTQRKSIFTVLLL